MSATHFNLRGIRERIKQGDARVLLVGDSLTGESAVPRIFDAFTRVFRPDVWSGISCPITSGTTQNGLGKTTALSSGATVTAPTMNDTATVPETYSNSFQRISPRPIRDVLFTADVATTTEVLVPELDHVFGTDYNGSSWATSALSCRVISWGENNVSGAMWSSANGRGARTGATTGTAKSLTRNDITAGMFDDDIWIPSGAGTDPRCIIRPGATFDETGESYFLIDAIFRQISNATQASHDTAPAYVTGLTLMRQAAPGFQTQHWHRDVAGDTDTGGPSDGEGGDNYLFTDATLEKYLELAHHPNIIFFFIGQNMNVAETSATLTTYKERYRLMVQRWVDATDANGVVDDAIYVLVPPARAGAHDTTEAFHVRYEQAATAEYQLAMEYGWGFINMFKFLDSDWPTFGNPSDVHPQAGETDVADKFVRPVWECILNSAPPRNRATNRFDRRGAMLGRVA